MAAAPLPALPSASRGLRVAQLIESVAMRAGGTSTAFLNVLAALRARPGVAVRAYTVPPPPDDPAWETIDAQRDDWTLAGRTGGPLSPGPLGRAVIGDVEAGEVDVLHLHGLWSADLVGAASACRRAGVPYVWEPHGMLVREAINQKRLKKEVFLALGLRAALKAASALVFVTSDERDHSVVPSAIGPDRRAVVPLPVRMPAGPEGSPAHRAAAKVRFGVPASAPCVVFLGRLHPVKRVEMTIRALAVASQVVPDLRLLLVGGGEDAYVAELRALADRLGVAERVVFAGWVQGDDKWLALAAGEALALNSLHENFGYVAVEALCVGSMPVLTRNLALAAELTEAGLCEPSDPDEESLATALAVAIKTADPAGLLPRARAWVQEHLSTEAVGARLTDLYASAGARAGPR